MFAWLAANLGSIVTIIILLVIVFFAARSIYMDKKSGKSSCGGSCAHCHGGDSCGGGGCGCC